jgi:peptidoglycan/LPS O-acetylase OafA/YrhL
LTRLRELDFLRGIAIILVLLRHIPLSTFTKNMGWVGVDLFFVLSGFLVSGLIFKEYIKFGNIKPKLFLIRRGFKIYPIYFLFYLLYLIPIIIEHRFNIIGFIGDMTFTQNYLSGWGYAYPATWSLAVEEHFYFLFAFFLWIGLRFNKKLLQVDSTFKSISNKNFELIVITLLLIVLLLRVFSNFILLGQLARNFTMTHLRIDSLLFGVLISYLFYFRKMELEKIFMKNSYLLYIICILGLLWTPFIDPVPSFFVKTFGFSILYISFGILLIIFLLKININNILNNIFTVNIVNIVSKIGYCSYSIYIIHTFIIKWCNYLFDLYNCKFNHYLFFIIASTISIISGMLMTYIIEKYFLGLRDKYYPSRV